MGLLEALAEASNTRRERCPIGIAMRSMDEASQAKFQGFLDSSLHGNTIAAVMSSEGFSCGKQAVTNHRNKRCSC